ncbi:MAG TPA: SDR family oxidoreductase [Burkholderiaceae bacterium]|jgi:NAD(P)-dependent dehydrogenase (short-subunit alcohol dehydrogenase family)|nr:SDR family oxidoreductase [Burkholderiaceae bacterium]
MDLELNNKVVVITGGSKGIGLSCAHGFLAEGARVAIVSRDPGNLSRAQAELTAAFPVVAGASPVRLMTVAGEMSDPSATTTMIEQVEKAMGPIDVLVTSAGAAKRTPPDELTPAAWRAAMDAKYFSYVFPVDAVIKRMAARGTGVIVNIIGAGGKVASPVHMAGGAANAALMLVTAGMANAYAAKGIRVNAVNPGLTLTERLKEGIQADARLAGITPEEALVRAKAKLPLGRIATPEEIANAVLFLASSKASYISGAIVAMDGAVHPIVV